MVEGIYYINKVKEFYLFLLNEGNLQIIDEVKNGYGFYNVIYGDENRRVSVSYENTEDYYQVIIFHLVNGEMPNYEDKTRTFHLNEINKILLPTVSKSETNENNQYFSKFKTTIDFDKRLLKAAKELRLCLKHGYLGSNFMF